MNTKNKCRVCKNNLFEEPLLQYKNMPKAAQNMPDRDSLQYDNGVDLDVYQCSGCGLVQLMNDPVSYYKEVIRAAAFSEEMREFRLKQFENFVEKYNLYGKKVLEVGCGKGEYLSLMNESGVEAYGIEYSQESVDHCVSNGLNVSKKYIENDKDSIQGHPFEAFFIMNFFEHLPDPNIVLKGIVNNLTDDGIGLIEVPNFNMIIQNKLFSEFINDHLFYFTKDTLEAALIHNGLEVVECNEIWYDYIISAVVRKRKKLDISDFQKHQEYIKNEIKQYVDNFESVAVWGAGHQALAVIALADLKDKIKYVVDDAPFKQGKYTPATHVPIVSAENLETNPVEAVVVMAASYSDEVAKKIRKNFDKSLKVSILRDTGLEKVF